MKISWNFTDFRDLLLEKDVLDRERTTSRFLHSNLYLSSALKCLNVFISPISCQRQKRVDFNVVCAENYVDTRFCKKRRRWRENFHFITKFSVNFLHSTEKVALEKLFAQFPRFLQLKILQIICLRNEVARGVSRRSTARRFFESNCN